MPTVRATRLEGVPGPVRQDAGPGCAAEGGSPGLYVHVPFCASRCRYCAFATGTCTGRAPDWARAVAAEAARRARGWTAFDTLYLGGGTPGLLEPSLLGALLGNLRRALPLDDVREATLEANPGDVTASRAAAWRALGLDRASLGVQSLDDGELRFLSRRHDARQASDAVRCLRAAGFRDVGIDLLYGIPGQDERSWERTLDAALALSPDHVSCYALTVEAGTPLARDVRAGRVAMPPDDLLEALYLRASERLGAEGFVHYEVSNLARGEDRVARHNSKYWKRVPVLGLGPAAHSFDGRRRWWNVRSLDAYLRRAEAGRLPTAATDPATPETARLEALALGFRTRDGVPLALLGDGPGVATSLDRQVADGRLEVRDGRARPTPRGMFIADALARRFA